MDLQRGQQLRIESDGRVLLHCLAGVLWITQHHAHIVLQAGQFCRLDDCDVVVVTALRGGRAFVTASEAHPQNSVPALQFAV